MKYFFTSDTHFGHANIIIYSNRPQLRVGDTIIDPATQKPKWVSHYIARQRANEMDDTLVANWNSVIAPEDTVIHLGDFLFGRTAHLIRMLRRLNFGKLKLVWGNHDSTFKDFRGIIDWYPDLKDRIEFLGEMAEIEVNGQRIVLNHYGMRVWNKSHRGAWHLYGHSHGSLPDLNTSKSFDVGVDCHNYTPLSFEQVKAIMDTKTFVPVDHHSGTRKEEGSEFNQPLQ
jgi:calcineurin-like phosphoesterase family protein